MNKTVKNIVVVLITIIVFLVCILATMVVGMRKEALSPNREINTQTENVSGTDDGVETVDESVKEVSQEAQPEQVQIDFSELENMESNEDAIVADDIVHLVSLLEGLRIDGKHISEWDVESLIAEYGLYMHDGKYQNEREPEDEYEEARILDDEKSFSWNKVSNRTGIKYAYELHENYVEFPGYTCFSFVTKINNPNGDNPWAKEGITRNALDNGIVDTKSFLRYLGISDSVVDSIVEDGQKYVFITDCSADTMIPAIVSCSWNGLKISAGELTIIYHEDIGRLEFNYRDRVFLEWLD